MKAVVADANAQGHLTLGKTPEPLADSNEVLIRATAFSLNRGEVRRAETAQAGTQIGWDTVGIVEQAARDGSGPVKGARVVGFSRRMQGWAEKVALPTRDVAEIPREISDIDAATLPVAALTALYALERCERLLASKVLVTGASGGVGHFACQLAVLMGADVTALLRRPDHQAMVEETGAAVVVSGDGSGLENLGPFRAIIDGVGGDQLGRLLTRLDTGGRAVLYGVSGGATTSLPVRELMFTGDGRVDGFHLYRESEFESAQRGLERLLSLMVTDRLKTLVSVTGDWSDVGMVATQLIDRDYPGKAVLKVSEV